MERAEPTVETRSDPSLADAFRLHIKSRLNVPPWVLLVQLFIGLGWLRAAVEKLIDPSWWSGAVITDFLNAHAEVTLPWYQMFVDSLVEPNLAAVTIVVVVAQAFAGIALLTGWRVLPALTTGLFLNLNFVAAGAVNPSLFYVICQMALLLWIFQDETTSTSRPLRLLSTASIALALINVPFISTLDPAAVVEDPAITLATVGLLTAVASRSGVRRPTEAKATAPADPRSPTR